MVALAHAVTALQTLVSRNADPLKELVVSVTQIRAGSAFNIIPETAWMNGTIRSFDRDLWAAIPQMFERVVQGVAAAMDCEATVLFERGNKPTYNDPKVVPLVRAAAAQEQALHRRPIPRPPRHRTHHEHLVQAHFAVENIPARDPEPPFQYPRVADIFFNTKDNAPLKLKRLLIVAQLRSKFM